MSFSRCSVGGRGGVDSYRPTDLPSSLATSTYPPADQPACICTYIHTYLHE